MGLLSSYYTGKLFTQEWVDALKDTPERGMNATVRIYDPESGSAVYNPATGTYTTTPDVVYTGMARVQPLRSARAEGAPGNAAYTQTVQFQIPIDAGKLIDLRPKHRVEVTACDLNPQLTKFLFAVQEILDSSNPIERTFLCTVNLESVVT